MDTPGSSPLTVSTYNRAPKRSPFIGKARNSSDLVSGLQIKSPDLGRRNVNIFLTGQKIIEPQKAESAVGNLEDSSTSGLLFFKTLFFLFLRLFGLRPPRQRLSGTPGV